MWSWATSALSMTTIMDQILFVLCLLWHKGNTPSEHAHSDACAGYCSEQLHSSHTGSLIRATARHKQLSLPSSISDATGLWYTASDREKHSYLQCFLLQFTTPKALPQAQWRCDLSSPFGLPWSNGALKEGWILGKISSHQEQWSTAQLHREVGESPSLEAFRAVEMWC